MELHRLSLPTLAIAAVLVTAGCGGSSTGGGGITTGPYSSQHLAHLRGGHVSNGLSCVDCHSASGFSVDFSQSQNPLINPHVDPTIASTHPTYDSATKTCSNVACHGNFSLNGLSGTASGTVSWLVPPPLACGDCHGMPPAGATHPPVTGGPAALPATCARCHPNTVNPNGTIKFLAGAHINGKADVSGLGCTSCHGDSTGARTGNLAGTDENLVSAPPVAAANAPAHVVGAHMKHVNPAAAGAISAPISCATCHPIPNDSKHATPRVAGGRVIFTGLAVAGGPNATYDAATAGCSATYCHGNFTYNGIPGGGSAAVAWTSTTAMTCTSCHGMPPATKHPAVAGAPNATAASCSPCHPDTVTAAGAINLAAGAHLNGKADVSGLGCTSCHGDSTGTRTGNLAGTDSNLPSSPPVATATGPAWAVGTHLKHVNPAAASAVMKPISCATCHPVPSDDTHATTPPASPVVFGGMAVANGANASYAAATGSCSATYCHGNFNFGGITGPTAAIKWDATTGTTCTVCHGMPPAAPHPTMTGTINAASCAQCHPDTVSATGVINRTFHIDGKAQGGDCGSCHALPPTSGRHTISDHRNLRCDECHPTGYNKTTTIAAYHNNKVNDLGRQAGYSCGLVGCPTGVRGTCTNSCHGRESW